MGRRIRLLVNYKNSLGIWNVGSEMIVCNDKNDFIQPETYAQWISEIYMSRGCTEVVCIEIHGLLNKKGIQDLGSIDISFISENFKKMLGRRWSFRKEEPVTGDGDQE